MAEQTTNADLIHGREIVLPNGAKVWGGLHNQSVVWKFTSSEDAVTTLCLSRDAMRALVQIYQGLAGCDENFARVDVELPDSADNNGSESR